ncbi:hypothetical protein [Flammeovirga aprica]|uniref:Uncharacterized protein n=1 Tax=Flammeovirga aprica JL-4 TaxID=694437 RepID=A0A7X9XBV5_9BACT|nr:hypothetical protein [Flammeovirga aprica]NME71083.1 hypothetical protein [Flammeovirga aprica JL-4]
MIIDIDEEKMKVSYTRNLKSDKRLFELTHSDIEDVVLKPIDDTFEQLYIVQKSTGIFHKLEIPDAKSMYKIKEVYQKLLDVYQFDKSKKEEHNEVESQSSLRSFPKLKDQLDINIEDLKKGSVVTLATNDYHIEEVTQFDFDNTTTHFSYDIGNNQKLLIYPSLGFLIICLEAQNMEASIQFQNEGVIDFEGDKYFLFEELNGKFHNSRQKFMSVKQRFFTTSDYSKTLRYFSTDNESILYVGERKYINQISSVLPSTQEQC